MFDNHIGEVPMIRGFILYYLNIKPTHGYEIQKHLQVSGTEQWAKIQSGSIYYALTKLEKEKFIEALKEERIGSRIRKIYQITENGKKELHREMMEELAKPLVTTGSTKFITDPMLNTLSKDECIHIIENHIKQLDEQKKFWEKWQKVKASDGALEITKLSFQMTIESLKSQIVWHEELLKNIDVYIECSEFTKNVIKQFDFDALDSSMAGKDQVDDKIEYIKKLKATILEDPRNAIDNLDRMLDELQKQK
jgi:DNA-binding PadR family transcriptional regulator